MPAHVLRRIVALTTAGLLVVAMAGIVPAVAAKPAPSAHIVTGSYIVEIQGLGLKAIHRVEIKTDAHGRVSFGYYEQTTIASELAGWPAPNTTKATVETVRFFTLPSGATAAEFSGQECGIDGPGLGICNWYHIVVSDGGPVGEADTFCGAQDPALCYDWSVGSGNIAIY